MLTGFAGIAGRLVGAVAVVATVAGGVARADDAVSPLRAYAGDVGRRLSAGLPPRAAPVPSLEFHPGRWLVPGELAAHATGAQRAPVAAQLTQLLDAYVAEMRKKSRAPYDLAVAYALYVTSQWQIASGAPIDDRGDEAAIAQVRGALADGALAAASDADKQRVWETLVITGLATVLAQADGEKRGDPNAVANARRQAAENLLAAVGAGTDVLAVSERGIVVVAGARGGGGVDLVYTVPPGFTVQRGNGWVALNGRVSDGSSEAHPRIVIAATVPFGGDAAASFKNAWQTLLLGTFTTDKKPLPYHRRLPSGLVLTYDGASMQPKAGGSDWYQTTFYLLHGNGKAVPILVTRDSVTKSADAAIADFFDHASIPGDAPPKGALFAGKELVGKWRQHSMTVASWYSRSGHYAGDATSFTNTGFALAADGTFSRQFAGKGSTGPIITEKIAGTWTIEDDTLVMRAKGRAVERQRIWGVGTGNDGPTLVLAPSFQRDAQPNLFLPGWVEGEIYHPDSP
jgi:uncharacterized protein DUF6683